MRLVKAAEMQEMDRLAIQELGIPGIVLMENAGRGASRTFLEHFDPPLHSRVLVLCGSGNNGGDGYVIARYLHQAGLTVEIVVLTRYEKVIGDALINLKIIRPDKSEQIKMAMWMEGMNHYGADFKMDQKGKYQILTLFKVGDKQHKAGFYYSLK